MYICEYINNTIPYLQLQSEKLLGHFQGNSLIHGGEISRFTPQLHPTKVGPKPTPINGVS